MRALILAPALLLAACGDDSAAPAPGGVTKGEAEALEDAAAMLDERRLPDDAIAAPAPGDSPSQPAQ